ncbi:DNA polymerase III subunit chi, partial [Pseudomonas sp. FW305-60]
PPILEPAPPAPAAPAAQPAPAASKSADELLHLEDELRAAAQLIMQDVIDDFAPHIETEIKRRLSARMERLLSQYE